MLIKSLRSLQHAIYPKEGPEVLISLIDPKKKIKK